jgi:hypothetical protein
VKGVIERRHGGQITQVATKDRVGEEKEQVNARVQAKSVVSRFDFVDAASGTFSTTLALFSAQADREPCAETVAGPDEEADEERAVSGCTRCVVSWATCRALQKHSIVWENECVLE